MGAALILLAWLSTLPDVSPPWWLWAIFGGGTALDIGLSLHNTIQSRRRSRFLRRINQ
jgi:hypothetical protein